jgi:hypothetical protein
MYRAEVCEAEILIGKKIQKKPVAWIAGKQSRSKYHRSLMKKYKWASHHPWLPVAPDPPEPE